MDQMVEERIAASNDPEDNFDQVFLPTFIHVRMSAALAVSLGPTQMEPTETKQNTRT